MEEISKIFSKTEQKCSNAFLLDETWCLTKSLNYINGNFSSLSSAIVSIQQTADYLNNVYTIFANSSAAWFEGNSNIKIYGDTWDADYSTVNSLSASWANEFALYYTKMYEISDWIVNGYSGSVYTTGEILTWLNYNFPVSNFADNQIISVFVNLYQNYSFNMTNFNTSYTFDCHVPRASKSVGCSPCPKPSRGCNHHGGAAGYGPCTNAYDSCSTTVRGGGNVAYTCQGYGGTTIYLPADNSFTSNNVNDKFSVRNIRLKYKKDQNSTTWRLL